MEIDIVTLVIKGRMKHQFEFPSENQTSWSLLSIDPFDMYVQIDMLDVTDGMGDLLEVVDSTDDDLLESLECVDVLLEGLDCVEDLLEVFECMDDLLEGLDCNDDLLDAFGGPVDVFFGDFND